MMAMTTRSSIKVNPVCWHPRRNAPDMAFRSWPSSRREWRSLITGPENTRSGRDRLAGYRAAHAAAGTPVDDALVRCESLTTAFAFAETQRLLALPRPPTAIIAGGNLMLAGVLRALGILGRRVPADISVLSSGDTELAELASPPVTVVRWDLPEYGRTTARLMLHRLHSPQDPPRRIVVPCELVLRKSCAAPRR